MGKDSKQDAMALGAKPARGPGSERSEIFAKELLSNGGDATKAARVAGYRHPKTYGPKKASRPEMLALIQERINAAAVQTEEVAGSLVMIMRENTSAGEPAMVRNAISAATQLCKILGMYQLPRPNEQDESTRDMFERLIVRYQEEHGLTRAEVVQRMLELNPELSRWITPQGTQTIEN
jgi:hypothetical protein